MKGMGKLWRIVYLTLLISLPSLAQQSDETGNAADASSPLSSLGDEYENSIKLLQNRFRVDHNVKEVTMIFFREYGSAPVVLVRPDGSKMFQGRFDEEKVAWYDADTFDMITIKDPVPKYGLVVTGHVKKNNLTLNSTAQAGDVLILTKPLGSGIVATAIKKDKAPPSIVEEAVTVMTHLNKGGSDAMNSVGVNACTDITGYGLLGHLLELCIGSKVSATIEFNDTPLMQGVYELAQHGFIPGGTKRNLEHVSPQVNFSKNISHEQQYILADAQTSGGLLISVPQEKAEDLVEKLNNNNCLNSSIIGKVYNPAEFSIYVN